MPEALGVLHEQQITRPERAGLAARGDLDATGDADDQLAPVLGLLGVASPGRAAAESTAEACHGRETLIASGGGSSGASEISMSSNRAWPW